MHVMLLDSTRDWLISTCSGLKNLGFDSFLFQLRYRMQLLVLFRCESLYRQLLSTNRQWTLPANMGAIPMYQR